MGKNKKRMSLLIVIIILLFCLNRVFAYSLSSYKWEGTSYPIYLTYMLGDNIDSGDSVISLAFKTAISDWNNAQNRIYFSKASSSKNVLNSYYLSSTSEYGYCDISYNTSTKYINYFLANVNAGNPNITGNNVARSVANHELGHGVGLDHSTKTAVMNTARNRTTIYIPQVDDINGMYAQYNVN